RCTWTAIDACGNSASCSQTITFVDTTPPALACRGNETHEWVSGAVAMFTPPQVSDACDPNPVVTRTEDELPASCPAVRVFRCTWTATDACSNHASCSQIITFVDTTRPDIVCPPNFSVQCFSNVPPCPTSLAAFLAGGGGAADTCDPVLSYSCSDGPLLGGMIRRTHTVTDDCNNSASADQIIPVQEAGPISVAIDGAPAIQVCAGTNLTLCATVTGTTSFTVRWIKNGALIAGANSNCLTLTAVCTNDAGKYC